MNGIAIGNGALATVTATIASGTLDSVTTIGVTGIDAAAENGISIPGSGAGGTVSITQPGWSISGAITPSSAGSGATVTLTGSTTSQTATADGSGNYVFSGLANGTYSAKPAKTGYTFSPTAQPVTVSGASVAAINFTGTQNAIYVPPVPDARVSRDQAKAEAKLITPAFSTAYANELLLAFVSADYDDTVVKSVTGAGLTWVLAVRTAQQGGTAEIWRAFASPQLSNVTVTATLSRSVTASLTVASFSGVDPSGVNGSGAVGAVGSANASSGAPTATIVTTRSNSLIIGTGDDPRTAVARTAAAGQSLLHQFVAPNRGTFWVQGVNSAVAVSGTKVTLNDSAPVNDPYNYSAVEILPAPQSGSGGVTSAPAVPASPSTNRNAVLAAADAGATMVNPATGSPDGVCSPGGLASLAGENFTSQDPRTAASFPLPTRLAGVAVSVNGHAAPLLLASGQKVNFQCPLLKPGSPLQVTIETESGGVLHAAANVMAAAAPAIFITGAANQGVILIGATNEIAMARTERTPSRPAHPGEYLTIYATGLGEVVDGVTEGNPAPRDRQIPLKQNVQVVFGNTAVDPAFAGLAPGTCGIYEVRVQLPADVPPSPALSLRVSVILSDGTVVESNPVTLAVGE
jgi:uncharacterized protein (TIGR03437 family)